MSLLGDCVAWCCCLALSQPPQPEPPRAEQISRLIQQLSSSKFAERQAATKKLRGIGEPALPALRKVAEITQIEDLRRRANLLIQQIDQDALNFPLQEGFRHQEKKDYQKAAEWFAKAIQKGTRAYHPGPRAPEADVPYLSEAYLRSARVHIHLREYEKAADGFSRAVYYANYDGPRRRAITEEWSAMTGQLLARWGKTVRRQVARDPRLRALTAKYPFVLLHSRRYAGGGYLGSAYSFLYETADPAKHRNDVQLLFDNGRRQPTFGVNMVGGQENALADLSRADFSKDPEPGKIAKARWNTEEAKAVVGHVYLERVQDDAGNPFYVVFEVVAVDPQSRYVAFVWRKLPGGKVVKE
jgi:tetratricopeptide (TPR) repeat protein